MYHSVQRVSPKEPMRSLHVNPKSFLRQMWILKTLGYEGCTVSQAIDAFKCGSTSKLVALTFDDAYENFYSTALPILQRFNFQATVYAVSNLIGQSNQWDLNNGISLNKLMNLNQLNFCHDQGIEIGCHTATHKSLINDNTPDSEMWGSAVIGIKHSNNEILSEAFDLFCCLSPLVAGVNVKAFCYPYGHTNDEVLTQVKKAGFTSATTMIRSRATNSDDPLLLPRIPITWHTLPHLFLTKILSKYEDKRRFA